MTCTRCAGVCSCGGPTCTPEPSPDLAPALANTQPLSSLGCTVLGGLQSAIDSARRISHTIGARAHRVRLVWQEQDSVTGKWAQVHVLELVPVRVTEGREDLSDLAPGQVPVGQISLREVSPLQVDEATLRGYLNGEQWTTDPAREFFYELQQLPYRTAPCPGAQQPERYRYVLAGVPELRTADHEWRVKLVAQYGRRERDGSDSTVPGEFYVPLDGAELMS